MIKKYKFEIAIIAVIIMVALAFVAVCGASQPPVERTDPRPFDHSRCQYPARTTNPPNGCDNTDPANPACAVKGLPEDCTEGLPKGTAEKQQAIAEHDKPFKEAKPAPGCYQ